MGSGQNRTCETGNAFLREAMNPGIIRNAALPVVMGRFGTMMNLAKPQRGHAGLGNNLFNWLHV